MEFILGSEEVQGTWEQRSYAKRIGVPVCSTVAGEEENS